MHHLIIRSRQNLILSDYNQKNQTVILDGPTLKGVKCHENLIVYLNGSFDLVIFNLVSLEEIKRITMSTSILDYNLSCSGRFLEILTKTSPAMTADSSNCNTVASPSTLPVTDSKSNKKNLNENSKDKESEIGNGNNSISNTSNNKPSDNIFIYDLENNCQLIKKYHHKNSSNWHVQWTRNANTFAHFENNQVILESFNSLSKENSEKNFSFSIARISNVDTCSISPDKLYPKIAVFSKGGSSRPDAIKIFLLPNILAPVAQKVFFKSADRVEFKWSPNGKYLLAITSTDVDTTGQSYYGLDNLYFLSGDGSFSCQITLDKSGPIHSATWNPNSSEFIVAYGFTPASKVMLYNLSCQPVFEFDIEYSMNYISYNLQSSLVCMGGFGNLPGRIEIWKMIKKQNYKKIASIHAPSTSICEWSLDGEGILTGTISPRLRVDNGYKIWSANTGNLIYQVKYEELFQVTWIPLKDRKIDERDWKGEGLERDLKGIEKALTSCSFATIEGNDGNVGNGRNDGEEMMGMGTRKKVGAYRPPGLRKNVPLTTVESVKGKDERNGNVKSIQQQSNTPSKEDKLTRKLKEKLESIKELKAKQAQESSH